MNNSLPPQAHPAPAPHPGVELAACVRGIQSSIHDWAGSHPRAARVIDPLTASILALLQSLIDLFTSLANTPHPTVRPAARARRLVRPAASHAQSAPRQARRAPLAPEFRPPSLGCRPTPSGRPRAALPTPLCPRAPVAAQASPIACSPRRQARRFSFGSRQRGPSHAYFIPLTK